ncbi:hypothetical protein ES703_115500 [subsurface metagenome]
MMAVKRVWSVVCPFCGRSYKRSVWDFILGSRLRGVLAFGQPVPRPGHRAIGKADVAASDGVELDAAMGAGFFSRFKARMVSAIFSWLGNGWLTRDDLREVLNKVGKFSGGFPVASFGPGVAEGGCRRDVASYSWGAETLDVVSQDISKKVWG